MVNKVMLIGNAGKDPEVRHFKNGGSVANFSLATNETYNNKDGQRITNTEWHNISVSGKFTGVVEKYVKKGDQLYIEGKLRTTSYDDKAGNKRYITEVRADFIKILGSRVQNSSQNTSQQSQDDDVDDLPI